MSGSVTESKHALFGRPLKDEKWGRKGENCSGTRFITVFMGQKSAVPITYEIFKERCSFSWVDQKGKNKQGGMRRKTKRRTTTDPISVMAF